MSVMKCGVHIIFIWLFFCPTALLGQNDSLSFNQIKLSIEQLFNPVNSGVKLSYERLYFKDKLSTEIGGTVLFPLVLIPFLTSDEYTQEGFRVHVTERFFYKRNRVSKYFGLNYEYQNSSFKDVAFFTDSSSVMFSVFNSALDEFNGKKELHFMNLLWGLQIIKNHFVFDLTLGIGLKHKKVVHYNRDQPNWRMIQENRHHIWLPPTAEFEGFEFNFPLSIKVGYIF